MLYKRHGWTLEGLDNKIDSIYSEPPREGKLSSLIVANRSATPIHMFVDSLEAEKLTSLLAQRGIFIVLQVCRLTTCLKWKKLS